MRCISTAVVVVGVCGESAPCPVGPAAPCALLCGARPGPSVAESSQATGRGTAGGPSHTGSQDTLRPRAASDQNLTRNSVDHLQGHKGELERSEAISSLFCYLPWIDHFIYMKCRPPTPTKGKCLLMDADFFSFSREHGEWQ